MARCKGARVWTEEEVRILRELHLAGVKDGVIADILKRDRMAVCNKRHAVFGLVKKREKAREAAAPNGAHKKCLCCHAVFFSPDRRQVHICDPCKQAISRGAA